jgi:hypothetical protein
MLRVALAAFMITGVAAWGQAKPDVSGVSDNVDRAAAYYHYTLARMYAGMAASAGRDSEYVNKAIENYKAAVKADPQTPVTADDLSGIYTRRVPPLSLIPAPRLPASR